MHWLVSLLISTAFAHPMDLGQLNIARVEDRFVTTLKVHTLVVTNLQATDAESLMSATLAREAPKLNALECSYLRPEMTPTADDYVTLSVVVTCPTAAFQSDLQLTWAFPFLEKMSDAFQLMTSAELEPGKKTTLVADRRHPSVVFGESARTFIGFVKMGLGHIGARPEEWRSREGTFQFPDGIDHILFVVALVLAGGTLLSLVKTATGFTVGHSITLALSTYKILHVHSKWIEVGIAFSIAYVALRAFMGKGRRAENWIVATLFGIVHGLGFSAALHDLELTPHETFTALAGFNIGVELGQIFFILVILAALRMIPEKAKSAVQRTYALVIFFIGAYWVYYRAFV